MHEQTISDGEYLAILNGRESFPFYRNFGIIFNLLHDDEAGQLLKAMIDYEFHQQLPCFSADDRVIQIAFEVMKVNIDASIQTYVETVLTNRENGRKGGRPRKNPEVMTKTETKPKNPDNDNENDNENDNDCLKSACGAKTTGSVPAKHKKKKPSDPPEEVDLTVVTDYFNDASVNTAFHEFLKARREQKVKNTPRAVKLLVDKLAPYPAPVQLSAIKESIMNNWKGLFPRQHEKNDQPADNPFIRMCVDHTTGGHDD